MLVTILCRAIAQAVSHRILTAAARFRAQVRTCEICDGQSGAEAGFSGVLRFPLPILIPPTAPHSSSGTISQTVFGVRSGLSLNPPQETRKKKTKTILFAVISVCTHSGILLWYSLLTLWDAYLIYSTQKGRSVSSERRKRKQQKSR
jgi:hypothetical protein